MPTETYIRKIPPSPILVPYTVIYADLLLYVRVIETLSEYMTT